MTKDKLFIGGIIVIVAITCLFIGNVFSRAIPALGGLTHNVQEDFSEGISVDGTERIDGDGNGSFANLAASGTLTITGETNTDTLITGGDVTSLTAGVTSSTAATFCNSSYIKEDPNGGSITFNLPTTASMYADCLTAAGDRKTLFFENTADASELIYVETSSTDKVFFMGDDYIGQNQVGKFDFVMLTTASMSVMLTTYSK